MTAHRIASGLAAALIGSAGLGGCGSTGTPLTTSNGSPNNQQNPTTAATTSTTKAPSGTLANYHPKIDPSKFSNKIDNPYFPLKAGTTHILVGKRDGAPTRHVLRVTPQTKRVLGVDTAVIKDTVTSNHSLIEKTTDWYAQDNKGNVWYFGEQTAEYANGVVTTTEGSWEAGVDNAQPGIIMPAHPKPGPWYRQEYRPGIALDRAKILKENLTLTVNGKTYHKVIKTHDVNPLDPSLVEYKWFAPGIGTLKTIRSGGGHTETASYAG
jgi:hypothetical protein